MPNKTYNYYSMLCISRGYQYDQNNLTTHLKSKKQHNLNDTHCDAIAKGWLTQAGTQKKKKKNYNK